MSTRMPVSIPLEQGSVLRQIIMSQFKNGSMSQSLWNRAVSYDLNYWNGAMDYLSLNPFGTGQCLTT